MSWGEPRGTEQPPAIPSRAPVVGEAFVDRPADVSVDWPLDVEQKVTLIAMPSEACNERLTNDRLYEANRDGWRVVGMQDHNGFLVFLLERAVPQ